MALDETGATLRQTLELVELKTPSAEPGPSQSHFTFEASRLHVSTKGRSNGHGVEGALGTGAGSPFGDGGNNGSGDDSADSVENVVSPRDTSKRQIPGDYFGLGLGRTRE